MANWEDLTIKMPIDRSSTLRCLISSRDKVVGQCSVNRAKLLGGRKNQKGLFVVSARFVFRWLAPVPPVMCLVITAMLLGIHALAVVSTPFEVLDELVNIAWCAASQLFGELENGGKPAGKIKFIYSLVDPAAPNQ
jgi:hypothetical protein